MCFRNAIDSSYPQAAYWYCWGTRTDKQPGSGDAEASVGGTMLCSLDVPAGMNGLLPQQREGTQLSFLFKGWLRLPCSRSHLFPEVPHNLSLISLQTQRPSALAPTQDTSEGPSHYRAPMGPAEHFWGLLNFSISQTCFLFLHPTQVDAKALPKKCPTW